MKRTCVIDISGLTQHLVQRDASLWIRALACPPRPMRPTLPVVPTCAQAAMTTGVEAGRHGVIAGGVFRRQACDVSFDERSNTLLNKKRFWYARALPGRPTVGLLFWSNPLAGAADVVLGALTHGPAGVSLAHTPAGLLDRLTRAIGPLDVLRLRGPGASWSVGPWIISAAEFIWRNCAVDLMWTYLPGINFEATRWGVDSANVFEAVRVADMLARRLAQTVLSDGGEVVIVSDGGYVNVNRVALPNLRLHEAGLLATVPTDLGELPDLATSGAFALTDHQVAHLFCKDPALAAQAAAIVAADPAVQCVLPREQVFGEGLGRERAGEYVALAHADAWFGYRWWFDDAAAPRAASRWDVPGKLGYDPCELFAPVGGGPAGAIDPNVMRIRASRGLVPPSPADWPIFAASAATPLPQEMAMTDVTSAVEHVMFGPHVDVPG